MKARIPRGIQSLTSKEKQAINDFVNEHIEEQVNREEASMQKIWLKYALIVLHQSFGFGEDRALMFLRAWKRIYRQNARFKTAKEQNEFIEAELAKIFKNTEYPSEWVDKLEDIGE